MSAEHTPYSRETMPAGLDEPDVGPETREIDLSGESIPPVGKMGGDTSRASVLHADSGPSTGTVDREETASRTKGIPREEAVPAVDAVVVPHARGRVLRVVAAIVAIAAVVALVVVTLAVSAGYIPLLAPQGKTAQLDLQGGNLQGANLQGASLYDMDLSGADLSGADLRGANAQRAHLRGANLARADLRYALLNGTDLRETDLRGANLQWVDLKDADLSGAQLEGVNLKNASLDGAVLPDGSQWSVSVDMRRFTDPVHQDFWRP
jgi:hypothetical protein